MKILYTDIDFVLSLGSEMYSTQTKWGNVFRFNEKAVSVYNKILLRTGASIVVTSDWKNDFTFKQLQEMFEWNGVCRTPVDVTPNIPGRTLQKLEEWRAKEILQHVEEHKPSAWVAIDDLNLSKWISEDHFVYLPRFMEGIKQSGKAQKVIEKLNI
jgi:hypothetical protein